VPSSPDTDGGVPQRRRNNAVDRCNIDGVMRSTVGAWAGAVTIGCDVDRPPPSNAGAGRRGSLPPRQTFGVSGDGGGRLTTNRATERGGTSTSRAAPAAR